MIIIYLIVGDFMYLSIKRKKIEIIELNSFFSRLKGLKFVFEPIDYGVLFPKKKGITTIFLCQKIDIVMTNKENKILYIYTSVKSEKYFLPKLKVYNIYFLPLGTGENLEIGDTLYLRN